MSAQLNIQKSDEALLCVGSLDIRTVPELRSILTSDLNAHADVRLDLAGISECDVSGIQLLYAAGRCAEAQGKRFSIVALSAQLETVSAALGLSLTSFLAGSPQLV